MRILGAKIEPVFAGFVGSWVRRFAGFSQVLAPKTPAICYAFPHKQESLPVEGGGAEAGGCAPGQDQWLE